MHLLNQSRAVLGEAADLGDRDLASLADALTGADTALCHRLLNAVREEADRRLARDRGVGLTAWRDFAKESGGRGGKAAHTYAKGPAKPAPFPTRPEPSEKADPLPVAGQLAVEVVLDE